MHYGIEIQSRIEYNNMSWKQHFMGGLACSYQCSAIKFEFLVFLWMYLSLSLCVLCSVTNVFEVYRRTCSAEEISRLRQELSSGSSWLMPYCFQWNVALLLPVERRPPTTCHYPALSCLHLLPAVLEIFCLHFVFSARQHAERAICYRPSVCPSVCLSVTRVDQSKTVEGRIMRFSPYSSPIRLVFAA